MNHLLKVSMSFDSVVINRDELLKRIREVSPYTQYAFCTQRAIDKLHRI